MEDDIREEKDSRATPRKSTIAVVELSSSSSDSSSEDEDKKDSSSNSSKDWQKISSYLIFSF